VFLRPAEVPGLGELVPARLGEQLAGALLGLRGETPALCIWCSRVSQSPGVRFGIVVAPGLRCSRARGNHAGIAGLTTLTVRRGLLCTPLTSRNGFPHTMIGGLSGAGGLIAAFVLVGATCRVADAGARPTPMATPLTSMPGLTSDTTQRMPRSLRPEQGVLRFTRPVHARLCRSATSAQRRGPRLSASDRDSPLPSRSQNRTPGRRPWPAPAGAASHEGVDVRQAREVRRVRRRSA
jgi:hypothetical protein